MIRTVITKHLRYSAARTPAQFYLKQKTLISVALIVVAILSTNCKTLIESRDVRPLVLRDVPAQRLAFRFEPDAAIPAELLNDAADTPVESIQLDFSSRRQEEALIKTVRSPDGQRALALYGTADSPGPVFRIDLYSTDGNFLRNITPPDLSCVFPETVAWSPQGNYITFVARKTPLASPSPTPEGAVAPETIASPLPSIAPAFPSVELFATEQIYICDRDGYGIKPLTSREGLIYFYFAWAPDNHAVVAIACRESEWDAREREYKMPAGRPRLITLDGKERLLDDRLTEALPVWSPDSAKVATAFETDAMIYDAATTQPTQGRIRLGDPLLAASRVFDANQSGAQPSSENDNEKNQPITPSDVIPASYNPIVRLKWASPEKLYLQTAYVRLFPNDFTSTFQRWHLITLSPQAVVLR